MKTDYYGVIYKITNLVNGKIYIGQSKNYKKRWSEHKRKAKNNISNTAIGLAINKYGYENFYFEVIDSANSITELNKLEEFYIRTLNSLAPRGYNLLSYDNNIKIVSENTKTKIQKALINIKKKDSSSKYFGVCYSVNDQKWKSSIIYKGKNLHIGYFDDETLAAQARDIEVIKYKYEDIFELNFPELKDKYINNEIVINRSNIKQQGIKKRKNPSSKYIGVSLRKRTNKWVSEIRVSGKRYYLGEFNNEIDAAKQYDLKAIELCGNDAVTNFEY